MSSCIARSSSSGGTVTPGSGRGFGRGLRTTATLRRMVLPAATAPDAVVTARATASAMPSSAGSDGSALARYSGRAGFCTVTRFGALPKPRSISSATRALRLAVDLPPKTVAMMRLLPRWAEAVRLKPAAEV